jgi:hypothetical protein
LNMQLGTTGESLEDVTGASGMSPASLSTPQSGAEDEAKAHGAEDESPPDAEDETPTHTATVSAHAAAPAAPAARSVPPAVPAFLRAHAASAARELPAHASQIDLDLALGAPLLPERAHDPHYYPGISDEPPPLPVATAELPWHRRRDVLGAGGGVLLLLLGLGIRSLFAGSSTGGLLVDVTPPDARVTLDGELLAASSGLRKRTGVMNGEHVLAAERSGFVSQRRGFTYEAGRGDLRIVLALNAEPPTTAPPTTAPPTAATSTAATSTDETPAPAAPEAPEVEQIAAETADDSAASARSDKRASARELAKQRRLERIRARRAAREAAGTARAEARATAVTAAAAPMAGKNAAPALLKLNCVPWAEVYVDKRHVGHTPLLGLPLTPGRHVIRLTNPTSGAHKILRIKASAGETVTQVVKL